jgi:hypothetical protein
VSHANKTQPAILEGSLLGLQPLILHQLTGKGWMILLHPSERKNQYLLFFPTPTIILMAATPAVFPAFQAFLSLLPASPSWLLLIPCRPALQQ